MGCRSHAVLGIPGIVHRVVLRAREGSTVNRSGSIDRDRDQDRVDRRASTSLVDREILEGGSTKHVDGPRGGPRVNPPCRLHIEKLS